LAITLGVGSWVRLVLEASRNMKKGKVKKRKKEKKKRKGKKKYKIKNKK
jgi:hypothetical protein